MPTALVTGGTGFLGGALVRQLLLRGWRVRALARAASNRRNLEGLEGELALSVGDLRDRESLRKAMEGVEVVFHLAARYELWNPAPEEIYRDNVDGTRNVLQAARDLRVERIVYTSTVGVLKIPVNGQPANESFLEDIGAIRGHYKRSKWYAEAIAREFAGQGLPVVIVNPTTPIGPGDVKPTPTGQMVLDFLRGRMLGYTDTGLNLVPVEDVAIGHILAAEKGRPGERYILGGQDMTLKKIFEVLSALTGLSPPRFRIPRQALLPLSLFSEGTARITGRPPRIPREAAWMAQKHMYFDAARAVRELGFAPGDASFALARAATWFREHGRVGARGRWKGMLERASS
jgi:dihydroflavonol-4-reductase